MRWGRFLSGLSGKEKPAGMNRHPHRSIIQVVCNGGMVVGDGSRGTLAAGRRTKPEFNGIGG
jgi:hypothetical protein